VLLSVGADVLAGLYDGLEEWELDVLDNARAGAAALLQRSAWLLHVTVSLSSNSLEYFNKTE
jgi:hypothetical protein